MKNERRRESERISNTHTISPEQEVKPLAGLFVFRKLQKCWDEGEKQGGGSTRRPTNTQTDDF